MKNIVEETYDKLINKWGSKEIGYQVGCGFMVGSPGQTVETLYEDLQN